MGLQQLIQQVMSGQPVSAGSINAPVDQLQQNIMYIYQLLNAAGLGSQVIIPEAQVSSICVVGTPVYFNAARGQYEPAVVSTSIDSSGSLVIGDSTQVWGVILSKASPTMAEILLYGYAPLNFTAAVIAGETVAAGTWYLSSLTAGKLTQNRPVAAVPVLKCDGQGHVFVCPRVEDFINGHRHLRFKLKARPAGDTTNPGIGNNHVITSPNPDIEGWLPAGHSMFDGKAPTGAVFGYTLWNNVPLQRSWPPLPPDNAILYRNGVPVPQDASGLVIMDQNGIWWTSDCYDSVPWDPTLGTSDSIAFSDSFGECPYKYEWTLELFMIQQLFLQDQTVVTSCTTRDNRLIITCNGNPDLPAVTGALEFRLDLSYLQDDVDPGGWMAIKQWDQANGIFHRGPVATGIYAGSSNILLSSDFQTYEQLSPLPAPLTRVHHGRVKIIFASHLDQELTTDLIKVGQATEQYFQNVMYLGMAAGKQQGVRGRFVIPDTLSFNDPVMQLRLRLLGRAAGTLPQLTVTGCRIPSSLASPTLLPSGDSAIDIVTVATLTVANQYIDVVSDVISVAAGDDFLFTVLRLSTDSYTSEVGILRITAILGSATNDSLSIF